MVEIMTHIYTIGIDPGIQTGIAISRNRQIINVKTSTFWDCIDLIRSMRQMGIQVIIEDPNYNKPVFTKKGANNMYQYQRIAQNVGSNKREASLIIEFCCRNKIVVTPIPPLRGPLHKINADKFKQYTGYDKPTSQHGRDAAMLIVGRF